MIEYGDWVRLTYQYEDGRKTTVERYTGETHSAITFDSKVNGRSYATKERGTIIPWRPSIGEWCWFWNGDEMPVVRMFDGNTNNEDYPFGACYDDLFREHNYEYCEPFIGKLAYNERMRG